MKRLTFTPGYYIIARVFLNKHQDLRCKNICKKQTAATPYAWGAFRPKGPLCDKKNGLLQPFKQPLNDAMAVPRVCDAAFIAVEQTVLPGSVILFVCRGGCLIASTLLTALICQGSHVYAGAMGRAPAKAPDSLRYPLKLVSLLLISSTINRWCKN